MACNDPHCHLCGGSHRSAGAAIDAELDRLRRGGHQPAVVVCEGSVVTGSAERLVNAGALEGALGVEVRTLLVSLLTCHPTVRASQVPHPRACEVLSHLAAHARRLGGTLVLGPDGQGVVRVGGLGVYVPLASAPPFDGDALGLMLGHLLDESFNELRQRQAKAEARAADAARLKVN